MPKTPPSILYAAVVADEPTAVLTARDMLARGGNAADAAVGLYFTLAVTLPSQAGIGSGGTCMVYDPRIETVKVLDFSHTSHGVVGDKLSIPMSVRGMAWLHARFGRLSWGSLLNKIASIAREGVTTSRGFISDLKSEVPRLANDATALSLFFQASIIHRLVLLAQFDLHIVQLQNISLITYLHKQVILLKLNFFLLLKAQPLIFLLS